MKVIYAAVFVASSVLIGSAVFAASAEEHKSHHPEAAAASSSSSESMNKMDIQMKAMRDMHDKMANAKTSEARRALMAEHMKTMQEGMSMMEGMGGECHDKKMKMACDDKKMGGMSGDKAGRHQMMEKRMQMMESMMQMMMDQLSVQPSPAP